MILSYPAIRDYVLNALVELSAEFDEFDSVSAVATAGIAHGAMLAHELKKPFSYGRDKAKAHGRQNVIEGSVQEGARVLVVEDLISTGGSSLRAVESLRAVGAEVVGVIAIFTYEFERAEKAFAQANCPFKTLSNYSAMLKEALANQYIDETEYDAIFKWRHDPQAWSESVA